MTLPTATVEFNEIFTRSAYNYVGQQGYKDNFHKGRPLLRLLRERGLTASGGNQISHRVNLGTTAQGGSYRKGQRMDIVDVHNETQANYDWKFYWEPMVLYFQDKFKAMAANTPGQRLKDIQSLAESKADEVNERLRQLVLEHLCASSAAQPSDLSPILSVVASSGALGGLNPATSGQEAWAAQINSNAVDFSSVGVARLRTLSNDASQGQRFTTDAYVLTQTFYEEALEIGDGKVQINQDARTSGGTLNADLGLQNLTINGHIAIWDSEWSDTQSGKVLALNFSGIHLVEASDYAFKFSGMESMKGDGINADVDWMNYVAELTSSNRGIQGALTNVA